MTVHFPILILFLANSGDFTKISQKLFNEARLFQKFFNDKHPDPNGCETEKPTDDDLLMRIDIRDIYYNLEKKFSIKRKVKCRDWAGIITNNITVNVTVNDRQRSLFKDISS